MLAIMSPAARKFGQIILFATIAASACLASAAENGRKYNVVLIVADDMAASLGCYGDPVAKTPNLDRLATRGVRFDHAYCQYPVCSPSRISFLSGRRPQTTEVYDNFDLPRKNLKDAFFLSEYFSKHGYFTGKTGKVLHDDYKEIAWTKVVRMGNGGGEPTEWQALETSDDKTEDGQAALKAAELIEQNKSKPFFIAAGFRKPHYAFRAPKKYYDLYPLDQIKLSPSPTGDRGDIPRAALNSDRGFKALSEEKKRELIRGYYACVSFMDAQAGVVLDAIERNKLWDSTIVVFITDHGMHLGEHEGLWLKQTLFEEATRVPLIVAAPGKKRGVAAPRIVELVDLYPTFVQLCGLPPSTEALEGISFAPLLDDPQKPWKKAAFCVVQRKKLSNDDNLGRMVRTERYRFNDWGGSDMELYDLEADPKEHTNLAKNAQHASTLAEMKSILAAGWKGALPASK